MIKHYSFKAMTNKLEEIGERVTKVSRNQHINYFVFVSKFV